MPYDRRKYEYFFPHKVYRCACLGEIITYCYNNGIYALSDIIDEIGRVQHDGEGSKKIFCVKCGNNNSNAIFSCVDHMTVVIFAAKRYLCTELPNDTNVTINICDTIQTYCCGCVKKYLREMYHYFHFVNFDFDFSVKVKKIIKNGDI